MVLSLINRIQSAFLQKDTTVATFLDIVGVFDNVVSLYSFSKSDESELSGVHL